MSENQKGGGRTLAAPQTRNSRTEISDRLSAIRMAEQVTAHTQQRSPVTPEISDRLSVIRMINQVTAHNQQRSPMTPAAGSHARGTDIRRGHSPTL